MAQVTLRCEFGAGAPLGPGKVQLLELIAERGSITAAGRAMGMSYRRAWLLVESLNRLFTTPLVVTRLGGSADNRAQVTPLGFEVIRRYRTLEAATCAALAQEFAALEAELSDRPKTQEPVVSDRRG